MGGERASLGSSLFMFADHLVGAVVPDIEILCARRPESEPLARKLWAFLCIGFLLFSGDPVEYDGPREADGIAEWLRRAFAVGSMCGLLQELPSWKFKGSATRSECSGMAAGFLTKGGLHGW